MSVRSFLRLFGLEKIGQLKNVVSEPLHSTIKLVKPLLASYVYSGCYSCVQDQCTVLYSDQKETVGRNKIFLTGKACSIPTVLCVRFFLWVFVSFCVNLFVIRKNRFGDFNSLSTLETSFRCLNARGHKNRFWNILEYWGMPSAKGGPRFPCLRTQEP
jgi:hypothetical protein